jgi:hypothetical protein
MKRWSFIFLLSILLIMCKKDNESSNPPDKYFNPGPPLLTIDFVEGEINGGLIHANYTYSNDTFYNSFSKTEKEFHLGRFSGLAYWAVAGSNLDLDSINIPITFHANNTITNPIIRVGYINGYEYTESMYDSTSFTVTLENFSNDTIEGTFYGHLIRLNHWNDPDSIITITNGRFKGHLIRI